MPVATLSSNARKYHDENPAVRWLLSRFLRQVERVARQVQPCRVLDAGCGEGMVLQRLAQALPDCALSAFDLSGPAVAEARCRVPRAEIRQASIFEIPWPDHSFDLVVCCEVLEHLMEPQSALRELTRVAARHILLTVPHEPWFRLGNLARGRHVSRWGNHPEHVQQWNPRSFRRMCADWMDVCDCSTSFPWIILQGTVRGRL